MISGICNHAGGTLGLGRLSGDYVVCPWHAWKFHRATGLGEPGFEEDYVSAYPIRVVGISSTVMNATEPRYSGSEALLTHALAHVSSGGCETRLIWRNDLKIRTCEGYYSTSAHACTWPGTIIQFDATDYL